MPDLTTNVAVGDPGHAGLHNAERTQINMVRAVRVHAGDPAFGGLTPNASGAAAANVAAINAALAFAYAYGGGEVVLPPQPYYVNGPISVPPLCELVGGARVTLNLDPASVPAQLARLVADPAWAPSSLAGVVEFRSKTPGGWADNTAHCGLRGVAVDCSGNSNVNLNGVQFVGPVYDPHLEDVFIWKSPHNGVHGVGQAESGITPTFAYHVRMRRVTVANPVNTGFNVVNFTDSSYMDCLAFSPGFHGWSVQNCGNSTWVGCRGEWSQGSGRGLNITGANGSLVFVGFTTDQNNQEGVRITAATTDGSNGGGIVFVGGKLHADGRTGSSSGMKVTGSSAPVLVCGLNVEVGTAAPTNGLSVDTSSNVVVTGSVLQGVVAAWVDGGGNSNVVRHGCLGLTGAPGSQASAPLADLPAGNNPLPQDQNLLAWTYDPVLQTGTTSPAAGVVLLARVMVRQTTTITNVLVSVVTAGSGLTAGQNFVGLYDSTGTLLSASADQSTPWASTGLKVAALSAPQLVQPGVYYLAVLANGTTPPLIARSTVQGSATVNAGAPAGAPRYATSGAAQTALPASISLAGAALTAAAWWGAVT